MCEDMSAAGKGGRKGFPEEMEFELKTKALLALAVLEKVLQVVLRPGRKRCLERRGAEAAPPCV